MLIGDDTGFEKKGDRSAGVQLQYTGTVTAKSQIDGAGIVEIEFRATNDQGDHVSGTAVVGLPLKTATA